MSEYTEQAENFLTKHGLKFRAVLLGCGTEHGFGDNEYRNKYRCTVSGKSRGKVSFEFWQSLHDSNLNIDPVAYDLLACIQKYEIGTFEDFCSEFGYDNDSRKSEKTYKAVVKEWKKVARFFTEEEITELQEIS